METEEPQGTLADVQVARRATARAVTPWWLRIASALMVGAVTATLYGDDLTWVRLLVGLAFALVILGLIGRMQGTRAALRRAPQARGRLIAIAAIAATSTVVAQRLQDHLQPGAASTYAAEFAVGVVTATALYIAFHVFGRRS